jgi:hypothetical protein
MLTVYGAPACLERLNTTWITISFVAALITAFTVQVRRPPSLV